MAAVPAGYEAFHSMKRKGVTLLCFLLASAMAMGITVYVDSYSVHEWGSNISSVGDVSISVTGPNIIDYLDQIRNIAGISKAAALPTSEGYIEYWFNSTWGNWVDTIPGRVIAIDQEFMDIFPGYITLVEGELPNGNTSQIAIPEYIAYEYNFKVEDVLNFSLDWDGPYQQVEVIGIFNQGGEGSSTDFLWGVDEIAIVDSGVMVSIDHKIYIDIDRNRITPFDPSGSLAFVTGIDKKIRELDPLYNPQRPWSSRFSVHDSMVGAINQYIFWVQGARMNQVFRSSAIMVLIVLVTFLAIRHNVNERRYEISMLYSRGASSSDLDKIVNREIVILSILSCLVGIVIGVLVSRIAIASTGFFRFDFRLMISEPFLVSLQSLIMSAAVGIALPLITLGGYRLIYSTKRSVDENTGKLAKLVRGFNFIRWDLLVVLFAGLLLLTLNTGGVTVTSNPMLNLILPIIPIPLFLGMASLAIKVLRSGAVRISRYLSPIVGKISASIGIRRIGKGASSGGAAAMVLVLAICLSWNSAIVDASLPVTVDNQARLSVGADITFALDESEFALWNEFMTNVTNNEYVVADTVVSEIVLSLTSDYGGANTFFAVNPVEYASIGYSFSGTHLNDSEMASMLVSLESVPDGAIISSDIANDYNLEVGDVLRATELDLEALPISFRIIGIVTSLPEVPDRGDVFDGYYPPMVPYPNYPYYRIVGQSRVMVNREFLSTQIDILADTDSFLCVQTVGGANGTEIANDLLEQGGMNAVYLGVWDSVSTRADEYMGAVSYHMDRSVDTMMTVLTIGTIMGAFAVYALEGIRARRREIALLRSNGANTGLIVKAQGAEMLVLMLFSLALLLVFAPLFLTTSVRAASSGLGSSYLIYPISVFLVVPWVIVLSVLMFLIVSVVLFIGIAAVLGSRVNLAETLNATWAEAAPYGGDV
ncbi:MAG: ABC transporter permease [Candidatus Thorarchaeota archaeon]|nr:ABC transporter permease [Candidatus Thorarchaeota archaeon]